MRNLELSRGDYVAEILNFLMEKERLVETDRHAGIAKKGEDFAQVFKVVGDGFREYDDVVDVDDAVLPF